MRTLVLAAVVALCAQAQNRTGAAVCAPCHQSIAATYAKTGMARSFYRATAQNMADALKAKPFFHEASNTYFETLARDGKFYQRRWQVGFDGTDTNVEEKQIDYVLGSGNHARTFLHLTARQTLQQLPLGWYAEKGGYWAMNPGYDRLDYQGSTRAVHYECMGCHNAVPRIPAAQREAGAEARYTAPLPEGIDCQRCHGSGEQHVATSGRAAIVNPAKLSPEREFEVCMQCHLETTSRLLPHSIRRFNRGPFDYRPGEPLGDFRLDFDRAPGKNEDVEVAGAAYRLRASQCFLKSAGKLRCTSCHNPHDIPRGEAAIETYNRVCQGCHADAHRKSENCVGCHMPKTRSDDAVHIVMTDHKIVRHKPAGDLLAEKPEKHETAATSYRGEVVLYLPATDSELYVALAQIKDGSNREAGLRQLSALIEKRRPTEAGFYAGLGEGYRAAGELPKALPYFEEATRRAPTSEIEWLQLGSALMDSGQWAKAETALRRARTLRPDDPAGASLLGWVLWQQDKAVEAQATLEAAVKLDPDMPETRNYLGTLFTATGKAAAAEREFREAVRINPAVAEYRAKLAALLAARGEVAEAAYHAKAAVEADPAFAPARLLFGQLLLARGDSPGGIRELQAAVRLTPASGRAHYELGVALARAGDRAGAVEHLKLAAQGPEADAKAAALQVLRSLGQ
jgi:predicted CXXCH cytochrome family protein